MIKIIIEANDGNRRLDRFLRKYLPEAPLSYIYKIIRKDVKVNGKREQKDMMLSIGDILTLYISDEEIAKFRTTIMTRKPKVSKSLNIAYEDENILIVVKPKGLLIHGDSKEKKLTLVNQVTNYLIEKGDYVPHLEKTFVPAAVNRLDRNTSGLVIFGKTAAALRELSELIRERRGISKFYLAIVIGKLERNLHLKGILNKNRDKNKVHIHGLDENAKFDCISENNFSKNGKQKEVETVVRPLNYNNGLTLVEVELITGRTHQIRAHLGTVGYPILGDDKYGNSINNSYFDKDHKLKGQMLHAYRLCFKLSGKFSEDGAEKNSAIWNICQSKVLEKGNLVALPSGRDGALWQSFFPELEKYCKNLI